MEIDITITYTGPGATKDTIDKFNNGIAGAWTGTFGQYDVITRVHTSPDAPNKIEVPKGDGIANATLNSSTWPSERPPWTAAHEAGHLMGLEDKYYKDEGKSGPYEDWKGNIMAEHGGKVEEKNIKEMLEANGMGKSTVNQNEPQGRSGNSCAN